MSTFDAALFHARVYSITRLIPYGRVTSYGHIARLAGSPNHSRMVGAALKFLQDETVPWQRVIGSSGAISERGDGGAGARRQAIRLREEGVTVAGLEDDEMGGGVSTAAGRGHASSYRVSLATYGWFPDSVDLDDDDDGGDEAEE